jgi:zinc protease
MMKRILPSEVPLFVEEDRRLPLVSISIGFQSGGATDPIGKDGLLRLMFRALREGCGLYDGKAFEIRLDELGAELSAEVYTTSAVITAQVIARNLEPFIDVLALMLSEPRFDAEAIERIKRESIAELEEARDNDKELANVAFRRALFGGHPFGRLSVGRISTVAKLERPDLVVCHRATIHRGNILLGIAGDITEAGATQIRDQILKSINPGERSESPMSAPLERPGRHLVFVDKPERTQTQVLIGRLGTFVQDDDHMPLVVANAAFGGTFTARMMREIRSKRGWSYGAYARLALERARHSFSMWTFPAAETTAECIGLELKLLEDLFNQGINPRERNFFVKYLSRSFAFDIDTANKRVGQALDIEALGLPLDYYSCYIDRLEAVTTERANAAVRNRLNPANLVIAVVGTKSDLLAALSATTFGFDSITEQPFNVD